jgi:hypothetical protein
MVLGNRDESHSWFKNNKLKLFIMSIISLVIIWFNKLYEKCKIKLLEVKYKILKIEKESIGEEVKENIETNISNLYKKYESYNLHSAGRHQILRIFTDIVFETLFNFMFSSKLVNI